MSIDYPAAGQIPQLRNLWKAAFGDGDEFLDLFFETAYATDRCRCITEQGCVTAALYWFDTFCDGQHFAYVYAVATDPECRNRGLCRILMADAAELLRQRGYDGILLYPATEALSRMYGKMGYTRCTTVTEFSCEAAEKPAAFRIIAKDDYARLRRKLLPPGGVIQEGPMLDLVDGLSSFLAGDGWIASVYEDGDLLVCQELLGDGSDAAGIVTAMGKKSGNFRTFGVEKPFVMGLALVENCKMPVYFGLPLD